jgi:hypothetical protein
MCLLSHQIFYNDLKNKKMSTTFLNVLTLQKIEITNYITTT